jgi:hypothetical protein
MMPRRSKSISSVNSIVSKMAPAGSCPLLHLLEGKAKRLSKCHLIPLP